MQEHSNRQCQAKPESGKNKLKPYQKPTLSKIDDTVTEVETGSCPVGFESQFTTES